LLKKVMAWEGTMFGHLGGLNLGYIVSVL